MKKTSSKSRPLSLKRETVRVLAASQLASAQGGDFHDLIRVDLPDIQTSVLVPCFNPGQPGGNGSNFPGACGTFPISPISRVIIP